MHNNSLPGEDFGISGWGSSAAIKLLIKGILTKNPEVVEAFFGALILDIKLSSY